MNWHGYNATDSGYRMTITEKLLDLSRPEFCAEVKQVRSFDIGYLADFLSAENTLEF